MVVSPSYDKGLRLSRELDKISKLAKEGPFTVERMLAELGPRGHAIVCFVFSLPFMQPIPLAGLSSALGVLIAFLGVFIFLDRAAWLPRRLRMLEVNANTAETIAKVARTLLGKLEHIVRPRFQNVVGSSWAQGLAGAVIVVSGLLLALPLPIPFSNTIPALPILLLSLGILEEDGLFMVLGFIAFIGTLIFFSLLVILPILGIRAVQGASFFG